MTPEEYFGDWMSVIDKKLLVDTLSVIKSEYKIHKCFPSTMDLFKAFEYVKYRELKVVFLGQDPYPQKDVATGVLFGNKRDSSCISPSLEVIKEAVINPEEPHGITRFDITLESWAKQGILMLNSALSVRMNEPSSHELLWRPFIKSLLMNISQQSPEVIFVLFGNIAKTFKPFLNDVTILEEQHPAFYARTKTRMPNTVFTQVSTLVKEQYGEGIKWYTEE